MKFAKELIEERHFFQYIYPMRFLAAILLVCTVFLSSFSWMVKEVQPIAKEVCCKKSDKKDPCSNSSKHNNCCNKDMCNVMTPCSMCCFFTPQPLKFAPFLSYHISKPVSAYKIGDLSAYHPDDWKPPKV